MTQYALLKRRSKRLNSGKFSFIYLFCCWCISWYISRWFNYGKQKKVKGVYLMEDENKEPRPKNLEYLEFTPEYEDFKNGTFKVSPEIAQDIYEHLKSKYGKQKENGK